MTDNPKPIRNYPFRGKIYTAKQIDELIEGGTFDPSNYYDKSAIDTLLAGKEDTLTAGDNITISEGVISAIDTTYTAGSNVSISDGVISATDTTYTAGTGISINDGVISAIGGGGSDWTEITTNLDWQTDIVEYISGAPNTIKFLKDVMLVDIRNSVGSGQTVYFPKNTTVVSNIFGFTTFTAFNTSTNKFYITGARFTDIFKIRSNISDGITATQTIIDLPNNTITTESSTISVAYNVNSYGTHIFIK